MNSLQSHQHGECSMIRTTAIGSVLLVMSTVSGFAQAGSPGSPESIRNAAGKHQFTVDIGVLEVGLSYARRISNGPFALGGRLSAAWEPWNTFEANVLEPMGGELFLRYHPNREVQLELGPSVLRYRWADDCAECSGTFAGAYASAMVGKGILSLGPTARFGVLAGAPSGHEAGILWGFQGRLRFTGGD
jgi:hypothetical protein